MLMRVEPGSDGRTLIHIRASDSDTGTTISVEAGRLSRTLAKGRDGIEVDCDVEAGRVVRYPHGKK